MGLSTTNDGIKENSNQDTPFARENLSDYPSQKEISLQKNKLRDC
jgi:hypothetical protein